MNFIWDIVLQAAKDNFESEKIFFKSAESFSPYYEHSFSNINQKNVENPEVEINPLYRFSPIFEYLLHPDVKNLIFRNQKQFIEFFFDYLTHILAEVDLCHGITQREIYIRQIRRELLRGDFGEIVKSGMNELSRKKQISVADELLKVFETGSSVKSFCNIMKQIFEGCFIYQNNFHPQKIYVYIGQERDESLQKKWQMIRETFLPIDIEVRIFWSEHFGILGVDATMLSDKIAIF